MRWEDERYVRLYTRDTTDWLALSFDAQALLALLLRKVDRAGLLPLGKHGKRGVAIAIGHPREWARLEPALEELLADGCVRMTEDGGTLTIPNFLEAQEANASDKARQQKRRETAAALAASQSVTSRDTSSHAVTANHAPVTPRHTASRDVTPSRAVLSRAEPSRTVPNTPQPPKGGEETRPPVAPAPAPCSEQPPEEAAHASGWTLPDAIDAVHREVMDGRPYRWDAVHDEKAATVLMSLCVAEGIPIPDLPEEAGRRFGRALVRSLWRYERAAGKAITLRELARRECWSINAEPPRRQQEGRGFDGVATTEEVAVDPWNAVLAKREAA